MKIFAHKDCHYLPKTHLGAMYPYNGHGDDITIDIDPAKVFSESYIPH
jgi:hypothetical protein